MTLSEGGAGYGQGDGLLMGGVREGSKCIGDERLVVRNSVFLGDVDYFDSTDITFLFYQEECDGPRTIDYPQETIERLGPPGSMEDRDPYAESGQRRARFLSATVGCCKTPMRGFPGLTGQDRQFPPSPPEQGAWEEKTFKVLGLPFQPRRHRATGGN